MFKKSRKNKIISFLVSGRGSNFMAVLSEIKKGKIKAEIGVVISDKDNAPALDKARQSGLKTYFIDPKDYYSREEHEKKISEIIDSFETDLIITAGYMRLLTPYFVRKYRYRIINIHPSLLPSFPGKNAQLQALDYGVKITGCTCHFIDEGTDTGPIIMQSPVPVLDKDNISELSSRILKEEHKVLSNCVKLFCDDKIIVKDRNVLIKR